MIELACISHHTLRTAVPPCLGGVILPYGDGSWLAPAVASCVVRPASPTEARKAAGTRATRRPAPYLRCRTVADIPGHRPRRRRRPQALPATSPRSSPACSPRRAAADFRPAAAFASARASSPPGRGARPGRPSARRSAARRSLRHSLSLCRPPSPLPLSRPPPLPSAQCARAAVARLSWAPGTCSRGPVREPPGRSERHRTSLPQAGRSAPSASSPQSDGRQVGVDAVDGWFGGGGPRCFFPPLHPMFLRAGSDKPPLPPAPGPSPAELSC